MKNKILLAFNLFLILILINNAYMSVYANQTQTKSNILVKVGDEMKFEIKIYNIEGKTSQKLTRYNLNGESIEVEFKQGLIMAIEVTELKVFDNATILPIGKIMYDNKTLNEASLYNYIRPTIKDYTYWEGLQTKYSNVKLENDSIISYEFKNDSLILVTSNGEIEGKEYEIDKFFWQTGWLAYTYDRFSNETGGIISEFELQSLSYVTIQSTSSFVFVTFLGSITAILLMRKFKSK